MIITFIGNRILDQEQWMKEKVKSAIMSVLRDGEYTTFYCGGYGAFDRLCESVCRSVQKTSKECELVYVTPYMTETQQKKLQREQAAFRYDSVLYPPLERVPLRLAIIKRNEWMIDQADLIISYVKYTSGGAFRSLEYARKKGKRIVYLTE